MGEIYFATASYSARGVCVSLDELVMQKKCCVSAGLRQPYIGDTESAIRDNE